MGEGLAEWTVTAPDGRVMSLQMAYFERTGESVVMEFGPVLDLPDVLGGKVAALATRSYVRDYLDTSAALERYTPQELIGFARGVDPGLDDADFAGAGQRLDQITDRQFAEAGISTEETARLRDRFASWPREAGRPDPRGEPRCAPRPKPGHGSPAGSADGAPGSRAWIPGWATRRSPGQRPGNPNRQTRTWRPGSERLAPVARLRGEAAPVRGLRVAVVRLAVHQWRPGRLDVLAPPERGPGKGACGQ